MAEPVARPSTERPPEPRADDASEPALRGRLIIAESVVERIATVACGDVEGVVQAGSGLDQVLGHRYPKVNATVAGDRTRIRVEVAVTWPYPLGRVCGQVRDHVRARVTELAGLQVDAVDVTAAKVVHAPEPERRRVQ